MKAARITAGATKKRRQSAFVKAFSAAIESVLLFAPPPPRRWFSLNEQAARPQRAQKGK